MGIREFLYNWNRTWFCETDWIEFTSSPLCAVAGHRVWTAKKGQKAELWAGIIPLEDG